MTVQLDLFFTLFVCMYFHVIFSGLTHFSVNTGARLMKCGSHTLNLEEGGWIH